MAALPPLREEVVRDMVGAGLFARAEADLNAGRFSEQTAYRNGVLTAMWDHSSRSATPSLEFQGSQVALDCDCKAFEARGVCVHVAGLALAWARDPQAFERVNEDLDLDLLFFDAFGPGDDEDEEDSGETEVIPPFGTAAMPHRLAPQPGQPAPASSPPATSATTVNVQWPNLTAALAQELDSLTVPQLRALGQRRGVKLSGTKRGPIMEALAAALGNVPALREAWPSLSQAARLLAGAVPFLETDYGTAAVHLRQALQNVNGKLLGRFDAALEELQQWGLLFLNRSGYYNSAGPLLFFLPPDEEFLPPAASAGLREVPAPPPLAFSQLSLRLLLALKAEGARYVGRPKETPHPLAAQAPDLRGWPTVPAELEALGKGPLLYQALSQRPLTVPPAPPLVADDDLPRLARAAGVAGEVEQAGFVLRLLVKLGLAHWSPGEPVAVREEGFAQYLALPPLQQITPLFNAYMTLNDWSELDLALAATPGLALRRQVRYGITYESLLVSLANARFCLIQLLRRAPAGQWIDLDQLVARARHLNVLHHVWPLPPGVFLELDGRSLAADSFDNWRAFYRPFVEAVVAGPLHWQGLLDLGYRKAQLAAVRVTDLGALAFFQRDSFTLVPVEAAGPALQFATDGSLAVAPAMAPPQLLSLLTLLGEARADPHGLLRYAVTPAGAMRAFQAGWDPGRLLETLGSAAGQPVPAPLAEALRGWWAHFGEVHLYTHLALMELADDFALTELLSSTSLAQHLLYRFSSRVIALRPEGVEALRAELVSRGYTPKVVER